MATSIIKNSGWTPVETIQEYTYGTVYGSLNKNAGLAWIKFQGTQTAAPSTDVYFNLPTAYIPTFSSITIGRFIDIFEVRSDGTVRLLCTGKPWTFMSFVYPL